MFRLWGKLVTNNSLVKDAVIEDDSEETRTHKIFHALTELCRRFDLMEPIWFDANINEFRRLGRTRFRKENFAEETAFDYFEIQVLEE